MKIHQVGEWNNNGARFQQRHVGPAQGHRGKLRPHADLILMHVLILDMLMQIKIHTLVREELFRKLRPWAPLFCY